MQRMLILTATAALLVVPSDFAGRCHAQQASELDAPEETSMQAWIEMLDSPRFRDRAQATRHLERLGPSAIEPLEQVILSGGIEAAGRALKILQQHFQSEDLVVQEASAAALKRIAEQSDHSKSKAAKEILEPKEDVEFNPRLLPMLPPFPRQINNVQVRTMEIKVNGGTREVKLVENGKSTRVVENEDGIRVEKDDGQGNITKKKYKNVDELKAKDPQAHKVYLQGGGGRAKNPAGAQAGPAPPGQLPPLILPKELEKQRQDIFRRHEEMRRRHQEMLEKMRRQQPQKPRPQPEAPVEQANDVV